MRGDQGCLPESEMHPRNPLRLKPPDYKALCPAFDSDFSNAHRLNESLYKQYLGLNLSIPLDNLCPNLGSRIDYILILEDLIITSKLSNPIVVDIGAGACAAYQMIGSVWRPDWTWLGTEKCPKSFEMAKRNLESNGFDPENIIHQTTGRTVDERVGGNVFMCNPPFYKSLMDAKDRSLKKKRPRKPTAMLSNEAVHEGGGEMAFLRQYIEESAQIESNHCLFTCLLGIKASIEPIIKYLNSHAFKHLVIPMQTGSTTRRWIVCWWRSLCLPSAYDPFLSCKQLGYQRCMLSGEYLKYGETTFMNAAWSRSARRGNSKAIEMPLIVYILPSKVINSNAIVFFKNGLWDDFVSFLNSANITR